MRGHDNSYSRLVAWLKVALPLLALAILSTVFLVAERRGTRNEIPYSRGEIDEILREQRIRNPNYAGVTKDGSAVAFSADSARPEAVTGTGGVQADKLIGTMTAALQFQRTDLRVLAMDVLATIGDSADSAVDGLVKLLAEPSETLRRKAAAALGKIGPAAHPALAKALADPDKKISDQALAILSKAGPEVIPSLAKLASSRDESVRARAGTILLRHGKRAVGSFLEALDSDDEKVRLTAVEHLKELGADAESALPRLVKALTDPNTHVCNQAQLALAKIGAPAVEALIASLDDADAFARKLSTDALVQIGPPAAAKLTEALKSKSESIRVHSA
ncbi:hypothetical protein LCGC14_2901140, partial [marine sediment metagenome]